MTTADVVDAAHRDAVERNGRELAAALQEALGQKLVAFAIGDRHPKTIGRYARGERAPEDEALRGLTNLYAIVRVLERGMRQETVKVWMLGSNPRLRGKAPIEVFHEGKVDKVMGAATAFVTNR